MTDVRALWLGVLQDVVGRSAHEVKGALNGVSVSLEVIRTRADKGGDAVKRDGVADFAAAAQDQLELLTVRSEALLFLAREHRPADAPADAGLTLRHLAALLAPAARTNGGSLDVRGQDRSVLTSAPAVSTRLALASGLLALIKEGGAGTCKLEAVEKAVEGAGPVVRFSHESAGTCSLEPVIVRAIAADGIRTDASDDGLTLVFPRYK